MSSVFDEVRYFLTDKGKVVAGTPGYYTNWPLGNEILGYLRRHKGGTHSQILKDLASPTGMWYSKEDIRGALTDFVDFGLVDWEVME